MQEVGSVLAIYKTIKQCEQYSPRNYATLLKKDEHVDNIVFRTTDNKLKGIAKVVSRWKDGHHSGSQYRYSYQFILYMNDEEIFTCYFPDFRGIGVVIGTLYEYAYKTPKTRKEARISHYQWQKEYYTRESKLHKIPDESTINEVKEDDNNIADDEVTSYKLSNRNEFLSLLFNTEAECVIQHKGINVIHKTTDNKLGFMYLIAYIVKWSNGYIEPNDASEFVYVDSKKHCFHIGCDRVPTHTYRMKKQYSESGEEIVEGEYEKNNINYRQFCDKHSKRGDQGMDDSDSNYEEINTKIIEKVEC